MGCLIISVVYGFCMLGGFYFLGTIGAVIGFFVASWIVAKMNAF